MGFIIGPKGLANPKSLLTTMDGTGAYTYDQQATVSGSKYVYKRNPGYWNPKAQMYDAVNVDIIGNPNAVLAALKTGQVDVGGGDPSTAGSAKQAGLQVFKAPFFNWGLQLLDRRGTLSKPLGDVRVRQAIAYAINRSALAKALVGDYGQASNQVVLPGLDGYDKSIGFTYDPGKAKSLLAAAGYAKGFPLTILTEPTLDPNDTRAQAIANALKAIGINAKLHVVSNVPTLITQAMSKKYPAVFWSGGGNDMYLTGQAYAPGSLDNPFGVTDPQLSQILDQAYASSGATRTQLYQKASKRFQELAWFAPVVSADVVTYVSNKVTNVTASVINPNPLPEAPTASLAWRSK
jgi:peptide/nickel transport system substrate-binding protein